MPKDGIKSRKKLFGRRAARARRLPLGILLVGIVVALLALIRPPPQALDIDPSNVQIPTATHAPTALPAPTDPHGGHIVFTCTRGETNQICMIAPDGTGFQQLTDGSANSYYPAISPSGEDVVFAINQYEAFDLHRLALNVNDGPRQLRSRTKQLTDNIGNAFSPSFSPNGEEIAFLNRIGSEPPAIWVMERDGAEPRQIYSSNETIVALAWSPDGSRIAFSMSAGAAYAYEVFVLDLQNLEAPPVRVSNGLQDIGGSIAWSPDQQHLLLFAGPAAAREVYRLAISDGSMTQLTFGGNNASPTYSPDGQYIVFNSLRNGGQADLFVMRADGHSTRQLTDFPEPDWQPKWGS